MGIRFQCPNGHKMNVKAFLAGKRAFCPKCGVRLVVPLESQEIDAAPATTAPAASGNGTAQPQSHAASPATASASPTAAPRSPAATVATAAPVAAHAAAPAMSPKFGADLSAAAAAVSLPATGGPPSLPGTMGVDPIAEAPQAVWYVRPRTGGQYGPAPGDIFRQWIAQRRVTADALVWRDGWTDWRLAGEVLPQLASKSPPAFAAAATATPAPTAATPAANAAETVNATAARYVKARRSKSSTIVAICLLAIIAIALVGVLIYVLNQT